MKSRRVSVTAQTGSIGEGSHAALGGRRAALGAASRSSGGCVLCWKRFAAVVTGLLLPLGAEGDALILEPPDPVLPVHTRMDLALHLDTGGRPAGAVQFELTADPGGAVEVEAVLAERPATRGGFEPQVTRSGRTLRVVALNALRPDAPSTPGRILTIRVRSGATNGVGMLRLTNVVVVGTAAHVDAEEVGCAPIPVEVSGAVCTVGVTQTIPAPAMVGLPAALERGRVYPARLEVDTGSLDLSAFELALSFPRQQVRLVGIDPAAPALALFADVRSVRSGAGRLFGCMAGGVDRPRGRIDVATIWLEALADTTAEVGMSFAVLCASAGLESRTLWAPGGTTLVVTGPAPVGAGSLPAPDPATVYTNALLSMPVAAAYGDGRRPQALLGRVTYNPKMLRPAGVRPAVASDWARAVVIANPAVPGTEWFWLTHLEAGYGEQPPAEAVVLDWTVVGDLLTRDFVTVNLSAAASGIGLGIGAATMAMTEEQYLVVRGVPGDSDEDGIDDWWEQHYGVEDAEADPDGDRLTNREEYLVLTDPTDRASFFAVVMGEAAGSGGEGLTISWPSLPRTTYRLLSTFALGEAMETVIDRIAASPPFNQVTVSNLVEAGRFYRLEANAE